MNENHKSPGGQSVLIAEMVARARRLLPAKDGNCPTAAAVADGSGRIFTAVTIESRTPGVSVCALRMALARARAEGGGPIRTMVAIHGTGPTPPCGLCRQSLMELAAGGTLLLAGIDDEPVCVATASLLPEPFLEFRGEGTT